MFKEVQKGVLLSKVSPDLSRNTGTDSSILNVKSDLVKVYLIYLLSYLNSPSNGQIAVKVNTNGADRHVNIMYSPIPTVHGCFLFCLSVFLYHTFTCG